MSLKLAVVTDIHFQDGEIDGLRKGSLGDVLLQRAVYRINRLIQPDAVVFLGDLLNNGAAADAPQLRRRMMAIVGRLDMPVIMLPGNHDGDAREFYRDFPRPPAWIDIRGWRLLPFVDQDAPEFNACRPAANLRAMLDARAGFDGPIVQLQHTSLFPPGAAGCPYNYTNIDAVMTRMREARISFSISGHYHPGFDAIAAAEGTFICAPALCEAPFTVAEVVLDGEQAVITSHPLSMPPELRLHDFHVHTPLAYCAENMDVLKAAELADLFGLAGMAFTEHSGQLYYGRDDYWSARCLGMDVNNSPKADYRFDEYVESVSTVALPARVGLELDCDFSGKPLLKDVDRGRVELLLGAMHVLPALRNESVDAVRVEDEFMALLDKFLATGIHVLAHPFRVFRRANLPAPKKLYAPTARLLKKYSVAAEINFHINEPDPEFVGECLNNGVKLSLGSDAHNLAEVGDFALHLNLLKQCGCDGAPDDVLFKPRPPANG